MKIAAAHFEEALALYREIGNLQGQAQVQNSLGSVYFDLGQWADADKVYRQAGQTFTQLGNIYNRIFVDNNLGGIALNQGRLDDALLYYQRALTALETIGGSLWVTGALHLNLGATHTRRAELVIAFTHLYDSQRLFEQAQSREMLPELHRRLAEAFLARQDFDQAREQADKSLTLAQELAALGEQGLAWRVIGAIQAAEGQIAEAETSLEKAISLLSEVGNDYGLACSQLSLAQLHDQRRSERRDTLLRQCLPTLERLGAMMEMEQAYTLMGDARPPAPEK